MTALFITGANRGLGLEFVRQYAAAGARIFATCRAPEKAEALRAIAEASSGGVSVHRLEVTDHTEIDRLAAALHDEPIDILINNAGILGTKDRNSSDIDYELWSDLFRVNTIAPLKIARSFRPHLERGRERKVITITSARGSTVKHRGTAYPYCSSKAAVNNVMHGLAVEWAEDGFTVAVVSPGQVRTDMTGPNARLSVDESISAVRNVIANLTPADNGRFLTYDGTELPW